ncbi:HWE histidine kinase domain-containing protein [Novosphingobium sp. ZN18A2]|uniref:HWE histidine kinase domain-containing protein n=1 Tax=Novosphingobium sp. ZN18A2 TaxID=3079861 RepID=UPI0030D249B6
MMQSGMAHALVVRERGLAKQITIAVLLVCGSTFLRFFIDHGRLGVQFVSVFPAILLASLLLDRIFTVLVAIGAVALAQWLLVGERWFTRVDAEHVFVAGIFFASLAIIVVAGHSLRAVLRRLDVLTAQQDRLNDELRERARDSLGMIRSVVASVPQDLPQDTVRREILLRIEAMASACEMLNADDAQLCRLPDGLRNNLAPLNRDGRIALDGPDCTLDLRSAVALNSAIHRLAAESAQRGALALLDGSVHVGWTIRARGDLAVRWTEAGRQAAGRCRDAGPLLAQFPSVLTADFEELRDGLACNLLVRRAVTSTRISESGTKAPGARSKAADRQKLVFEATRTNG